MFKYYYEGQLIRTSENHGDYKYCVVLEAPRGWKEVKNLSSRIDLLKCHVDHYNRRYKGLIKVYIDKLTMEEV